jgi:hypothetical protein
LPCGPGEIWDAENGVCVFKELSLSCTDVSNLDDCINPSYSGNNAAKVDIKNYVYGNEPTTFIDKSVLPQPLQDVIGTCDSSSCQLIAADFSTKTFTSKTSIPYVINTIQSTNENKAAVVRSGADEPTVFMTPPGFSMSQYSIGSGTKTLTISGDQDSCAVACVSNLDCKGFNLNIGSDICDFYTNINTDTYIDSQVSFRKEDVPSTVSLQKNNPAYTNLSNQGSFCRDVNRCNADISKIIERTSIPYFVTTDLEACEYCPPRKYHRGSSIYTNELGVSLRYNTLSDVLYQLGTGGIHDSYLDLDKTHAFRPYIYPGADFLGVRPWDPYFFLTLSARLTVQTITLPDLTTEVVQTPTMLWTLIPCDYVDNGYFLQRNDTLRYLTNEPFSDPNLHYIQTLPDRYTNSYNYAIFIRIGFAPGFSENIPSDPFTPKNFEWDNLQPATGQMKYDVTAQSLANL